MMRTNVLLAVATSSAVWMCGCGEGVTPSQDAVGAGTVSGTAEGSISGIAADPYIVGATFCEDRNANGLCDSDEQVSTPSDANGAFSFADRLTAGSLIIVQTMGMHNGVPYALENITATVTDPDATLVVSPLSTLGSRGLTNEQIAEMLQLAGVDDVTADDVSSDPMDGISGFDGPVTEAQLAKIRSSIAAYACLRIMNGSDFLRSLTGTELYVSGTDTNGGAVHTILLATVGYVKQGLDPNVISSLQAGLDAAPIDMPDVSADDVVRTAVAITDYLSKIGFEVCNATGGDYEAALVAVADAAAAGANIATWSGDLGQRFYGIRNRSALGLFKPFLPAAIQEGMDCVSDAFIINDDGAVACFTQ